MEDLDSLTNEQLKEMLRQRQVTITDFANKHKRIAELVKTEREQKRTLEESNKKLVEASKIREELFQSINKQYQEKVCHR